MGLWRFEVESGLGDEPFEEVRSVLHSFQSGLHQCGELVETVFGEVRQGPFQV